MSSRIQRIALLLVTACLIAAAVAQPSFAAPVSVPGPGVLGLVEGEEAEETEVGAEEAEGEEVEGEKLEVDMEEEGEEAEGSREAARHHRRKRHRRHGHRACHRSARVRAHGCSHRR